MLDTSRGVNDDLPTERDPKEPLRLYRWCADKTVIKEKACLKSCQGQALPLRKYIPRTFVSLRASRAFYAGITRDSAGRSAPLVG